MINLDSITNENNKKHNERWPYISDHPYRIMSNMAPFLSLFLMLISPFLGCFHSTGKSI